MKAAVRTTLGVPAGFVFSAVLSIMTTTALRQIWPMLGSAGQGTALEVLDATYALAYMGVGTFVAARIGFRRAGYILAAIFGLLSLGTALARADAAHSVAYQWVLAVAAWPVGVLGARVGTGSPTDATRLSP